MLSIVLVSFLLFGVYGQQTDGGANVIFARPSSSNTSDENSQQNYENAHLVFVTEFNRGVHSSTPASEFRTIDDSQNNEAPMETTRFVCGTGNQCAFRPYTWEGFDRNFGRIEYSVCDCPPDKRCDFHRDNIQLRMYEYLCKPTETTTAN
ncbi:uncharacterized protein TNCV_3833241 [Trichonephila clavipes]|nr:uncharacterized protein TNCV_3833191 [Trichonephila clavipes]GFU32064.1 uncharacterized protein TNCV_3833201 [Trichonephila clavipes]GFU32068.1 uncharacterized protein TNCV_3833231 [Trichonephila clavipes]GFU32069.1 uncharacterized protein TNCV_3833241 [Trichonephila clavipes]